MLLSSVCEFRGVFDRESKSGNKYQQVKFEDNNGDQFTFYKGSRVSYQIPVEQLLKGKSYSLKLDYHYNNYDQRFQLDLLDVEKEVNGK